MHLQVLCREASSALAPTMHYLEQKDRVRRFEEHTRNPLDRDTGRILAGIIKNAMTWLRRFAPEVHHLGHFSASSVVSLPKSAGEPASTMPPEAVSRARTGEAGIDLLVEPVDDLSALKCLAIDLP